MRSAAQLAVYETFEDVYGRKSTIDELIAEVATFTQQSVLWVCAVVVAGLQLWNKVELQPFGIYVRLLSLYFDPSLRGRFITGYWSSEPRRLVFHRRQILLIAKLAVLHCSARGTDLRFNADRFGSVLLKANDQFDYGLLAQFKDSDRPVAGREDFAKIIAEMVAVGEDASAEILPLMTLSHLMLTRFANELRSRPDFVDLAGEYQKAAGLTIEEFEAMIFGVHSRFGAEMSKKLITDPGVLPLKDENFATTAIPVDKASAFVDSLAAGPSAMAHDLQRDNNGPNDFTIFRKFPLIRQYYNLHLKTAWCGFLMMDNLFFLEKVLTGPYWNANAIYGLKLRGFWGAVFEKYVNELMRRACAGTQSQFIADPRPLDNPNTQICDGIVVSGDSIVLMEYKSAMFRADTKYGGNYLALGDEITKKFVHDRESKDKKGVWQLSDAVQILFGPNASKVNPEIALDNIKNVYLYIVTLDSIGGTIGMSPFLNTILEERLDRSAYSKLHIRPLFCSDIEALEVATGYFARSSLPQILEKWFLTNPSLAAPLEAIDFGRLSWQTNDWLRVEWDSIFRSTVKILFPDKDPDDALAEAKKRGKRS